MRRHRLHSFSFTACRFSAVIKSAPGEELLSFRARCGTRVAEKNDARRRVILPILSLAICVESCHCFRFSIHRSPLRIVIKKIAIKYIRYGTLLPSNIKEFLKIAKTFRPLFGSLEILIVMGYRYVIYELRFDIDPALLRIFV